MVKLNTTELSKSTRTLKVFKNVNFIREDTEHVQLEGEELALRWRLCAQITKILANKTEVPKKK